MGNTPSQQYPGSGPRPVVRVPAQPRQVEQPLPGYKQRPAPLPPQNIPSYKNPHCLVLPRDAPNGILKSRNAAPILPNEDYYSDDQDAGSELDSPDEEFERGSNYTSRSYNGRPRSESGPFLSSGNYTPNGEIIPKMGNYTPNGEIIAPKGRSQSFDDYLEPERVQRNHVQPNYQNGLKQLPNGNYRRPIPNHLPRYSVPPVAMSDSGRGSQSQSDSKSVTFSKDTSQKDGPELGAVVRPMRRQKGRAPPPPRPPPPSNQANSAPSAAPIPPAPVTPPAPPPAPMPPAVLPLREPAPVLRQKAKPQNPPAKHRPSLHEQLQEDIIKAARARASRGSITPPKLEKPKTDEEEFKENLIKVCKRIETYQGDETDVEGGNASTTRDSEWEGTYDPNDYKPKATSKFLVKTNNVNIRAKTQDNGKQMKPVNAKPADVAQQSPRNQLAPPKQDNQHRTNRMAQKLEVEEKQHAQQKQQQQKQNKQQQQQQKQNQQKRQQPQKQQPQRQQSTEPPVSPRGLQASSEPTVPPREFKPRLAPPPPVKSAAPTTNRKQSVDSVQGGTVNVSDSMRHLADWSPEQDLDMDMDDNNHIYMPTPSASQRSSSSAIFGPSMRMNPQESSMGSVRMYRSRSTDQGRPSKPKRHSRHRSSDGSGRSKSSIQSFKDSIRTAFSSIGTRAKSKKERKSVKGYFEHNGLRYGPEMRPVMFYATPQDPYYQNYYPAMPYRPPHHHISPTMPYPPWYEDPYRMYGHHGPMPVQSVMITDGMHRRALSMEELEYSGAHQFGGPPIFLDQRRRSSSREYGGSWSSLRDDYDQSTISRSWRRLRNRSRGRAKSKESVERRSMPEDSDSDDELYETVPMPLARENSMQEATRKYQDNMQRGNRRRPHGKKNGGVSSSSDENKPPTKLLREDGLPPTGYRGRYRKNQGIGDVGL